MPPGVPFTVDPDVFKFSPDPNVANWQQTPCVEIIFAYGSIFLPPIRLRVGVEVGAPSKLRDGRELGVREAQLDSSNAAQAAAYIVIGALDAGLVDPSEVQPRFVGYMGGAMLPLGMGYRVRGCRP